MRKIREYIQYRKNKAIAKKEFYKLAATTLPEITYAIETYQSDGERLKEIFSYMMNLTPEEIQKVLVHSIVETLPTDKEA